MSTRSLSIIVGAAILAVPAVSQAYTALYDCGSAWEDTPVEYRVNLADKPSSLSDDEVLAITADSFEVWAAPCCSSFDAQDGGTTTAFGTNTSDSINAVSFIADDWPSWLGDEYSTLGVTQPLVYSDCTIASADVVFNEVTFDFIDGSPQYQDEADLQAIATHEFGHFLGLGHSNVFEATMYAAYVGGTGARTLHSDDQDGVCDLYETSCNCSSADDCANDEECIDSVCQVPPCESDDDCDTGLECNGSGDCVVPPCGSDDDCVSGFVCDDGACRPNPDCPTCGQCEENADCGAQGVCIPAGYISESSHCSSWCNGPNDCPGNTDCFIVPTEEGDINLCFNDDADVEGPCPGDFVCTDDDEGPEEDPCDRVTCDDGESCNPATGECQGEDEPTPTEGCTVCAACEDDNECGDNGACLAFQGGGPSVCSVPCDADGSCPGTSSCFQLEDEEGNPQNWCLNNTAPEDGICGGDWECADDPSDPCANTVCESGTECDPESGDCVDSSGTGDDPPDDEDDDDDGDEPAPEEGCSVSGPATTGAPVTALLAALALVLTVRRRRS